MKRVLCFFLCVVLLLPLYGCNGEDVKAPADFYYLQKEYTFGSENSVISAEVRETSGFWTLKLLLAEYLRGPRDPNLLSPFPPGTYVVDILQEDTEITVTMSDSISNLTGIDLTLACSALAKTLIGLTGAEQVQIQAITATIGGERCIILTEEMLTFLDLYQADSTNGNN